MAFENLSEKLGAALKKLKGKGVVTEKDIKESMREIKLALLEADVNYKVVKDFIGNVSERAVGADVLESLTPGQQIIKIVNDELAKLMGSDSARIEFAKKPPTIVLMAGLQGAGKTTFCAKLAGFMRKKHNKRPLLVACDIYRPAAVKQLEVVGKQIDIPVFQMGTQVSAVSIATAALEHAKQHGNDFVIIDTAGRLHIDDDLMQELEDIKAAVNPDEILLVIDAMTGQDAVNIAESFNARLEISGVVMTKLDGDTRGGAALSVKAVTGKPIKFAGVGEKLSDIEEFHPDRMASRILGSGDVLSLIEKAQAAFDEKDAAKLEDKIRHNSFNLDDFLAQMQQMKKMGPLTQIMKMIPGVNAKAIDNADIDERKLDRVEAIIKSMTMRERENPSIINASRKRRIAAGSGNNVSDVNLLLKQFEQMQQMMKQFSGGGLGMRKLKKKKKRK
ncbi:MAG TPA: signal recognition particle protein [Clostridiales bacterium]|nr:signal recognition particle protein [Clostridiales bacterium]HBL82136.1 signal recognition particle protein [Clostridiales bacterium]